MEIKYLKQLKSIDDVKSKYRQLSKSFHPDKGGDIIMMQELNLEYQYIIKYFYTYKYNWENELLQLDRLKWKIEPLYNIIDIKIQIINDVIWVTGKTFNIKELLKSLKYRFSSVNKAWYFSDIKYYTDNYHIDDLIDMHGTKIIKS